MAHHEGGAELHAVEVARTGAQNTVGKTAEAVILLPFLPFLLLFLNKQLMQSEDEGHSH